MSSQLFDDTRLIPLGEEVRGQILARGFAAVEARHLSVPPPLEEHRKSLLQAWNSLVQDRHMGDGGTYRYRRYSRFLLRFQGGQAQPLEALEGHSIFQERRDNPLNGGVLRTFAPLQSHDYENPFLHHLVAWDAEMVGLKHEKEAVWAVGVHFVRIVARGEVPGHPAPEGIHIDAERFTVQHMVRRHNVEGGVFSAYNEDKMPIFHWLQIQPWDCVFFTGSTWHSASPIRARDASIEGERDILLIDFVPSGATLEESGQ